MRKEHRIWRNSGPKLVRSQKSQEDYRRNEKNSKFVYLNSGPWATYDLEYIQVEALGACGSAEMLDLSPESNQI